MEKLAKHGHQANKAALYGELCALLFAKSHYDEVRDGLFITALKKKSLIPGLNECSLFSRRTGGA